MWRGIARLSFKVKLLAAPVAKGHENARTHPAPPLEGDVDNVAAGGGFRGICNVHDPRSIKTPLTDDLCASLHTGDMILLSGEVFTARDAAHRRLQDAVRRGEELPFNMRGAVIFYAGPSPTRPGRIIGSIGPTTSYRMDHFAPLLMEQGMKGMIGKGKRSPEVVDAMRRHKAVYFGAIGGIAALTSRCVRSASPVAYADLGPEAILRLELIDLPVVVINDTQGRDLYDEALKRA
jgi:fumarate hydratase subunit beta